MKVALERAEQNGMKIKTLFPVLLALELNPINTGILKG